MSLSSSFPDFNSSPGPGLDLVLVWLVSPGLADFILDQKNPEKSPGSWSRRFYPSYQKILNHIISNIIVT